MSEVVRTAKATLRANREKKAPWRPQITRMSDVQPEEVAWLWYPYIPLRKLTILEGDPGLGKTFLALKVAAKVTNGWPIGNSSTGQEIRTDPRNVIFMTAEDGLADTIRPRLDAADADASRVFVIEGKEAEDDEGDTKTASITLQDLATLEIAVEEVQPSLVVIDPIQGFMGRDADMNKANDVREILRGFADLAEKYCFAIIAIRHLRKSGTDRAVHRGMGSIDFAAFARSMMLVAEDPNDEHMRVMAHSKSSLAPEGPALAFEIRQGRLRWTGESQLTPDDLLAPRDTGGDRSALEEAREWLEEALQNGPVPSAELQTHAKELGHAWRTVRRAQKELGVIVEQISLGSSSRWQWRLE